MNYLRRIIALLLCLCMLVPAQELSAWAGSQSGAVVEEQTEIETQTKIETQTEAQADGQPADTTGRIIETLPLEELEPLAETETERIVETLPLEEVDKQAETQQVIETLVRETLSVLEGDSAAGEADTAAPSEAETAETERAIENLVQETLSILDGISAPEETQRIAETLPLVPLETGADPYAIYWNPGVELPVMLETEAAQPATSSNSTARKGSDRADGTSPERPLKTLTAVLERAERMQAEENIPADRITIYAMNPMEVAEGELFILNGGGVTIASWPERNYNNDTVFYVNGGQLLLLNTVLESGNKEDRPESTQLVYVHSGSLQMGKNVTIEGRVVLDYRKTQEEMVWGKATASEADEQEDGEAAAAATPSNARPFALNDYIISDDANTLELLTDRTKADTKRAPIVELQESFEMADDLHYLLEVRGTGDSQSVELVRTLYSDNSSGEEFLEMFSLAGPDSALMLEVESIPVARVRNSGNMVELSRLSASDRLLLFGEQERDGDNPSGSLVATEKRLLGVLSDTGLKPIYWNPGGPITVIDEGVPTTYPAGNDEGNLGNDPPSALKTLKMAIAQSNGGQRPIIAMQTLDLGISNVMEYLDEDRKTEPNPGTFSIRGESRDNRITIMPWDKNKKPSFRVPAGIQVTLENLILKGDNFETMVCDGGDILIEEFVRTDSAMIQVKASSQLGSHPIKVNSYNEPDEKITIFYSGINENLAYRFLDVIVPGDRLAADIAANIVTADAVGDGLLERFRLHPSNRDVTHGGSSQFDWTLRKDTPNEDLDGDNPQNLELYAAYYYDAIYLDGVNGSDLNLGASCHHPVKTWDKAVQIWQAQMNRSIDARTAAAALGQSAEYINRMYPMPTKIYICGTVTVTGDQTGVNAWELADRTDYNGAAVKTEVVSHTHIPAKIDGSGDPVHDLPDLLIKVSGPAAKLELRNIFIRNITDVKESVTVLVENSGNLTLTGKTVLSGERPAETIAGETIAAKETTMGIHVKVTGAGGFTMPASWTGSIETRGQGVVAAGSGTKVVMKGGTIQKNNSLDEKMYEEQSTTENLDEQLKGTGVVLSGGAAFTMDGGMITENLVYQAGAGVHLTDSGTEFIMTKGEISKNQMARNYVNGSTTSGTANILNGQGIGIYAGSGTKIEIGNGGARQNVRIQENLAYRGQGIGIWAATDLKVNGATISANSANVPSRGQNEAGTVGSSPYNQVSVLGGGVYISNLGSLEMKKTDVMDNQGRQNRNYSVTYGAGIYIGTTSAQSTITDDTVICGNLGGREDGTTWGNMGGGIFTAGDLRIADSQIGHTSNYLNGNRATFGAGIFAQGINTNQRIQLTIKDSEVSYNYGRGLNHGYGYGAAINTQYVNIEIQEGVTIEENVSSHEAAGIRALTSTLTMRGTQAKPIRIKDNLYGHGTAIRSSDSVIDAVSEETEHVIISGNTSGGNNGGGISMYKGELKAKNIKITGNHTNYSGGAIITNQTIVNLEKSEISGNSAGNYSGGLYIDYGRLSLRDVLIKNNQAKTNGSGLYIFQSTGYLDRVTIKENSLTGSNGEAGGAICSTGSGNYYLSDCVIENNQGEGTLGGGLFLGGNASVYFSESEDGKFSFTGNRAKHGGGIYVYGTGAFFWDIKKPAANTVADGGQGNNLYMANGGNSAILKGTFVQPANSPAYNVYLNVAGSTTSVLRFDPVNAKIEKNTSGDPNALFLNTGSSFLTYLRSPADDAVQATLPIDVNTDVFSVGSIVVRPANLDKITMFKPNSGLAGTVSYDVTFPTLQDASAGRGKEYAEGGDLPSRTQLGAFKDEKNAALTNIVLVSQGVYLASFGEDLPGYGDDPLKPVKSFAYAKWLLEKKIQDEYDLRGQYGTGDGYVPFIYICGTVDIKGAEADWELDYDAPIFTTRNQRYKIVEEANGGVAYPAQVRRFASFVTAPMIQLGDNNPANASDFTMGKIIIDGMAEAVIIDNQLDKSPMVKVNAGSKLTLTAYSRLTNNFNRAVELYGDLELNSQGGDQPASQEKNQQLINHHGVSVWIRAGDLSVLMKDEARIMSKGSPKRLGSIGLYAVYGDVNRPNVKVEMQDSSAIVNIKEDGQNATLLERAINIRGENTTVSMTEKARIENVDVGIELNSKNGKVTLNTEGTYPTVCVRTHGVIMHGESSLVLMQDRSSVEAVTAANNGTGVEVKAKESKVYLLDFAKVVDFWHGIYCRGLNSRVYLNACDPSDPYSVDAADAAGVSTARSDCYAIVLQDGASGTEVYMGANSYLKYVNSSSRSGRGFWIRSNTNTASPTKIVMKDNSKISNLTYGMEIVNCSYPLDIIMSDQAAIEGNASGIVEDGGNWNGAQALALTMNNQSRISGGSNYGIFLNGRKGFTHTEGVYYHKITMNDQAIIGGDSYYNVSDPASGNAYAGIYANSPLQLEMNDDTKISGNSSQGNLSQGIFLDRYNVSTTGYQRRGTAKLVLKDRASVSNNRGHGVYIRSTVNQVYAPVQAELILDGSAGGKPSIKDNTDGVYLGEDAKLKLINDTFIGKPTVDSAITVDCYGEIQELDGRSVIEGRIHLRDGRFPITLTHSPFIANKYNLWLEESYLGQIVVKPGGTVSDASAYLDYFVKEGGSGMAAEKSLRGQGLNIVLDGENNVYLSGTGNDAHNGLTPSTAVRTFKRAKELLQTGNFTSGAKIYIVNSRVDILAEDADWSFDPGGYVTNTVTGHTWKPLVVRHSSYNGVLMAVIGGSGSAYAREVTFKDITVDGDGENRKIEDIHSNSYMLYIYRKDSAVILGEGAVLQNNHVYYHYQSTSSYYGAGVFISGGTLTVDGGTIQGMVRELGPTNTHYNKDPQGASAIYCTYSAATEPGKVIIKKGRISDNRFQLDRNNFQTLKAAAIFLAGQYTSLEISGGTITGNQVVTDYAAAYATTYGGAIYSYYGTVTMNGGSIRDNQGGYGSAIYYCGTRVTHGEGTTPDDIGSVVLTAGQIKDNGPSAAGQQPKRQYAPIYVEGWDFRLDGGGTEIGDSIYLASKDYLINVSQKIYQYGRNYHIYLNQTSGRYFAKGDVVVQPDGNWVADVTDQMSYFQLHSDLYVLDHGQSDRSAGTGTAKEHSCLILMKAVYLDSDGGNDANDGTTPAKAVATFTEAKNKGSMGAGDPDYYVIYVSGKTTNTAAEDTWTLPKTAYMCRYTGFPVYQYGGDGQEILATELAYQEYMIEPSRNLTLDGIRIQGRRVIDAEDKNGNAIVHVKDNIEVVMKQSDDDLPTMLERNNNNGTYLRPESIENLPSRGGAFQVDAGGVLNILGGTIRNTAGTFGGAIYLGADDGPQPSNPVGRLYITNSPAVTGSVYLGGIGILFSAYIETDQNYVPASSLAISLENDFSGRPVVKYTDGFTPGLSEKDYYKLEDSVLALYEFINGVPPASSPSTLELLIRQCIYLDGEAGSDANNGSTPESAFRTLEKVYTTIRDDGGSQGALVFIVRPVPLSAADGHITLSNLLIEDSANDLSYYQGYYQKDSQPKIEVSGQVYFKRYARPYYKDLGNTADDGFNKTSNEKELFIIENGGKMTIRGIVFDGHALDSEGTSDKLVAKAVSAKAPLVTVKTSGELFASMEPTLGVPGAKATPAVFINSVNANKKTNKIGTLYGADIYEGSSAGIEIFETGTVTLEQTQFKNLKLGPEVVSGGTDIYHYGGDRGEAVLPADPRDAMNPYTYNSGLKLSNFTLFEGTVFLEGLGYEQAAAIHNRKSSRYIEVNISGKPLETDFQIMMRDSYNGREVVYYTGASAPPETDIGYFRLEERVKDFFFLSRKAGYDRVLELKVPAAVYVDGINGSDDLTGELAIRAGSTPATPVKSLKRAYDLLRSRGGGTIYVVNAVQLGHDALISGVQYKGEEEVNLGNTSKVRIVRYIQPDFAYGRDTVQEVIDKGYNVLSYTGPLLNVKAGVNISILDELYLDGHSKPKVTDESQQVYYSPETTVSGTKADLTAKAPLITVEEGAVLSLLGGAYLLDNNNTYDPDNDSAGTHGGAIYNSGTVTADPAADKEMFANLQAQWGAVIYQDGMFTIKSNTKKLHLPNAFYLTTSAGGEDRVIRTEAPWPAETVTNPDGSTTEVPVVYDVEMDNAVPGRDVIKFLNTSAYDPDADAEHEHFALGTTVPERLFLVEAPGDPSVLELQDWKVFKVAVPSDIYLIVHRRGTMESTRSLKGVRTDTPETEVFSTPQYKILNEGRYDVKVSISGFENKTTEAGITHDLMNLKEQPSQAVGAQDIYLAVKGIDTLTATPVPYGFAMAEKALEPYGRSPVTAAAAELGVIEGKTKDSSNPSPAYIGSFSFVGQVGSGFVEKYKDVTFPLNDPLTTKAEIQKYIDGTDSAGVINARAKYQLKYKLEMAPKRPGGTGANP